MNSNKLFRPLSLGWLLMYSGSSYSPYSNYTWQMLPNGKIKNSGTSGVDLQLYSGNPLDFQGSQSVQNISTSIGNYGSLFLSFTVDTYVTSYVMSNYGDMRLYIKLEADGQLRVGLGSSASITIGVYKIGFNTIGLSWNNNTFYTNLNSDTQITGVYSGVVAVETMSIGNTYKYTSSFFDGQLGCMIISNNMLTQEQITQSVEHPNQFFKDMSTNSNTLFCTDFRGNSGYIADSKNYSVGSELVVNGGFDTSLSGWTQSGTSLTWVAGKGKYLRAYFGDRFIQTINNLVIGNKYIVNFTLSNISAASVRLGFSSASSNSSIELYSSNSDGSFSVVVVATATTQYITGDTNVNGDGFTIDNVSIKQISGIYPITNYSATQRTNFTQESKGLQDLTRLFDNNGFFLDNTSYLNCNGKGYADTSWIPKGTDIFTLEAVLTPATLKSFTSNGSRSALNGGLHFGTLSNGKVYMNSFNGANISINTSTIAHVVIASDGVKSYYYVNNVKVGESYNSTKDATYAITLGCLNSSSKINFSTDTINLFKVHDKLLTALEIESNYYTLAKKGVLLPDVLIDNATYDEFDNVFVDEYGNYIELVGYVVDSEGVYSVF